VCLSISVVLASPGSGAPVVELHGVLDVISAIEADVGLEVRRRRLRIVRGGAAGAKNQKPRLKKISREYGSASTTNADQNELSY
jgi:hypothetical protein